MIHLREISRNHNPTKTEAKFPFNVPVIESLDSLEVNAEVTFFVGENGSGKSTLLEAIACAVGSISVGSESVSLDPTLEEVRQLANTFKLTWNKKTRRGFFLRAEDFFGYAKRISQLRSEFQDELHEINERYKGRSELAKGLAKMPFAREIHELEKKYGQGLDTKSHGESFLTLFQSRFVPGGLYLLDEPEAPLSPVRQLGFINLLKQMVGQDAQFIISTHSPIIMAYPGAEILNFDKAPIERVEYSEVEHVSLTKGFLNNPDRYLNHL